MNPELTRHAQDRLRQRGYRKGDLEVVLESGTPIGNAVFLSDQDVDRSVAQLRKRIQQLHRLRGTAVILDGDVVLSVYRPSRSKLGRMLATRNGRGLGVGRHDPYWCETAA